MHLPLRFHALCFYLLAPLVLHAAEPLSPRSLDAQPAAFTPYDPYMAGVRAIFERAKGGPASRQAVFRSLETANSFRYESRDHYRPDPPQLTARRRAGDCKSKALWLYDQLNDRTALYVIGKAFASARISHAWVYWQCDGRWWILDPTARAEPIPADLVSPKRYIPYYSFGAQGRFRHKATRLLLPDEDAASVAGARGRR